MPPVSLVQIKRPDRFIPIVLVCAFIRLVSKNKTNKPNRPTETRETLLQTLKQTIKKTKTKMTETGQYQSKMEIHGKFH